LTNRTNEQIKLLSGGEYQLLTTLVATEMLKLSEAKEKIILLDEHIAHLDPTSSDAVMSLTQELISKMNLTIIMVTHNIQTAMSYGDRIIVLKDKEIALDQRYNSNKEKNLSTFLKYVNPSL
jgi:putative ABC transport system ATP-binding protein